MYFKLFKFINLCIHILKDESSTVDFSKELETDVSLCEKVADISLDMVGDFVFCSLNNRS